GDRSAPCNPAYPSRRSGLRTTCPTLCAPCVNRIGRNRQPYACERCTSCVLPPAAAWPLPRAAARPFQGRAVSQECRDRRDPNLLSSDLPELHSARRPPIEIGSGSPHLGQQNSLPVSSVADDRSGAADRSAPTRHHPHSVRTACHPQRVVAADQRTRHRVQRLPLRLPLWVPAGARNCSRRNP